MSWHTGQTYEWISQRNAGLGIMYLQMAANTRVLRLGQENGVGTFSWPNGNRYTGSFADGQREGDGVFFWRDGTVYRGQFLANKQHGYGVKEQPNNLLELQQWQNGEILRAWSIRANEFCDFQHRSRAWMFSAIHASTVWRWAWRGR